MNENKFSLKEKVHFIGISFGSLMEVFSELQNAVDLGYISESKNLKPSTLNLKP